MRQSRRRYPGMVMRAWDRCEQENLNLGSEEIKGETLTSPAGGQETSSMPCHVHLSSSHITTSVPGEESTLSKVTSVNC